MTQATIPTQIVFAFKQVPAPEFDNSPEARTDDTSGTPVGMIQQHLKSDDVLVMEAPHSQRRHIDKNVLVDFPFGVVWKQQSGFNSFVRFRERVSGKLYGLIRYVDDASV